jgi:hypothetical protein
MGKTHKTEKLEEIKAKINTIRENFKDLSQLTLDILDTYIEVGAMLCSSEKTMIEFNNILMETYFLACDAIENEEKDC